MLNIFKRSIKGENVTADIKVAEKKYPKEVIEIHNHFNGAGEALLAEAQRTLSFCRERDKEKGKLLNSIGFVNTPQAKEVKELEVREYDAEKTANLVEYYRINYPNNKFITERIVKWICEKYNLVCGDVSLYKGFVPTEKLKQIQSFKVNKNDRGYAEIRNRETKELIACLSKSDLADKNLDWCRECIDDNKEFYTTSCSSFRTKFASYNLNDHLKVYPVGQTLKICAPIKDMDTTGMKLSGYKLEKHIPDPVVLQPVNGGYLIVTAWGDEASDELVVNQKMN